MTLPATKTAAKPESVNAKKRPSWKVVVNNSGAESAAAAEATAQTDDHIPAERLAQAARMAQRDLPYRRRLQELFGQSLDRIVAAEGPEVEAALHAEHADAATVDDCILLRRDAPLTTVAHEVAHMLQKRGITPIDPSGNAAEDEAARVEHDVAEGRLVTEPSQGLAENAVAFRRSEDIVVEELLVSPRKQANDDFQLAVAEETTQETGTTNPVDSTEGEASGTEAGVAGGSAFGEPELAADLEENPVPTFESAPMPEIEVDEAAAEAAAAEAEAALSGSDDADGMMTAFKDAPPSIKAAHHDQLETNAGELVTAEQANFDSEMPVFEAQMSGTDDLAAPEPVATPESAATALEDGAPGPVPEAVVDPTPDAGQASLNDNIRSLLTQLFGFSDSSGLGQAFNRVKTGDNEVDTSAGERPAIPLEGEANPERVTNQDSAAREDATAKRQEATQGVLEGPGPETVTLTSVQEEFSLEPRVVPEISDSEGPVEGADGFRNKELDPEVVVLFDQFHQDAMADSMAEAEAETAAAVSSRDTDRDTEVAATEAERDRLNAEADEEQRDEVATRRQEVQDARQTAVDAQAEHVADLETEADTARIEAEDEIDTQITDTNAAVETSFAEAEAQAEAEVTQGEEEAEEERLRQEREAENSSWWDRATNWVADQFDKLTSFINDVFDAVRSAVKGLIDAVKEAALALIDLAASAITAAIEAFGEILKAGVNALLAEHFPEVAAALNGAIDGAVEVATNAVNAVAERLKAGISALLDALAAAIDAILAVFQAAINAALAIAKAALTGDWAALAKLILEPILRALGIEPQSFYDTIGRALEALDIIIDDPLGFLSNLLDSVKGGIQRFADNFLTHLQAGIIAWLTGALGGGITIPTEWSLMAVLDLARQILGLTVDMFRRVAVRVIGEAAVEKIEFFMGYVTTLIAGGWSALWEQITQSLSNLKDMVLEQIKSFLTERIIVAAITWLASLFNPVGALIKLVMTIWNLIMFLKDQLARIIEVATRIINSMYEIAKGVLAPAIQGVEVVLGRLLPIAIDLLARLLGLGNVAGRVQLIIADVRQKIEDAIVRLIERVLAAFRGGGSGGADESPENGVAPSEIMRPISLQGDGESHTLTIRDEGDTVEPMINSTPMTLATWLNGRSGAPFTELADNHGWEGEDRSTKLADLTALVATAKQEEELLDQEAEQAEDALNAAASPSPAPATVATAADETEQVAAQAQDTKRAIEKILDFFGIAADISLEQKFADDIARLNPTVSDQVKRQVLPRLDARLYSTVTWQQAAEMLAGDVSLPAAWKRPAASDGILRRAFNADYRTAVQRIVGAHTGTQDATNFPDGPEGGSMTRFLNNYLTRDLNTAPNTRQIVTALLSANGSGGGAAAAVSDVIRTAADRAFGSPLGYDDAFRRVTGSFYKDKLVPNSRVWLEESIFGKYFQDEAENTAGEGSGQDKPLSFFVTDTARGGSSRFTGNRSRLANAVRGASPGNHEWIPASKASSILAATATRIASGGDIDSASGIAKLLKFQHEVRTPTSKLIYKPLETLKHYDRKIPYISTAHAQLRKPFNELDAAQKLQAYPKSGPQFEEKIRVLQAHAGGLDAGKLAGGQIERGEKLQWSSPDWHAQLEDRINGPIDDNIASTADGTAIRDAILGFYRQTIWRGAQRLPAPKRAHFDFYYTSSDAQWRTYGQLKTYAARTYTDTVDQLETDMNKALA